MEREKNQVLVQECFYLRSSLDWMAEKECVGSVGRVLPKEYLYFTGDGAHNYFTTEWQGGQTWDWSLESPYEG